MKPKRKLSPNNHKRRRPSYLAPSSSSPSIPPSNNVSSSPTSRTARLHNKTVNDNKRIELALQKNSIDKRPERSCFVRVHSFCFCAMNIGCACSCCPCGIGECIARHALQGKRTKGHPVYTMTTADDRKLLDALDIAPKSIERLHEVFVQIDRDGSGEISLSEFFRFFSHKRRFPQKSKFSKRVFQIMDADGSGELSFVEFTVALWNFCTFTKSSLLRFSFELYDCDDSGFLDLDEIRLILREVYGKHKYKSTQASQHILEEIESRIETGKCVGGLNLADFNEFCRHHPALLYPAFELQTALQQNVMGMKFWAAAVKKRKEEKKKIDKLHSRNQMLGRGRRPSGEIPNATEDMSYKELVKYLDNFGKTNEEARLDKEWWEIDQDLPPASPTMIRTLDKEEEERAKSIELKLNRASSKNKIGSGLKLKYQVPFSSVPQVHGMSRVAIAKKMARKMKVKKLSGTDTRSNNNNHESAMEEHVTRNEIVRIKIAPWTCNYCKRMNTETDTCKACQKPKKKK